MPIQRVLPILLAAFPFSASAATVNVTEGQVLINRGQGFQQVEGSAEASPGEMIVTTPEGGAEIGIGRLRSDDPTWFRLRDLVYIAMSSRRRRRWQRHIYCTPPNRVE